MPPKLTEEENFQQAAAEGRKRALDDAVNAILINAILKNREDRDSTALPSAVSASTMEATEATDQQGDNGSAGVSE